MTPEGLNLHPQAGEPTWVRIDPQQPWGEVFRVVNDAIYGNGHHLIGQVDVLQELGVLVDVGAIQEPAEDGGASVQLHISCSLNQAVAILDLAERATTAEHD